MDYVTDLDRQAITREAQPIAAVGLEKDLAEMQTKLDDIQRSLARLLKFVKNSDDPPETIADELSRLEAEKTLKNGKGLALAKELDVLTVRRASLRKAATEVIPDTPGYHLFLPPFGKGAYGKVGLARNAAGEWRALKMIYLVNFENNSVPDEREFNGVRHYHPFSDQHTGLLRVDFVSEKLKGYF